MSRTDVNRDGEDARTGVGSEVAVSGADPVTAAD